MSSLFYASPARRWKEALPLGNGKLAAMVYGGIRKETIALNDATLWSGYPRDYTNAHGADSLAEARRLIFDGKNVEADAFVARNMHGEYTQSYLPLAHVTIVAKSACADDYVRRLDLDSAVFSVRNGGDKREAFVSFPDGAMYYRMNFDAPTDVAVSCVSRLRAMAAAEDGKLILSGFAPDSVAPNYVAFAMRPVRYDEGKGMGFALVVSAESDGRIEAGKRMLKIRGAREVCLKIVCETGFERFDKMPSRDIVRLVRTAVEHVENIPTFDVALVRHIDDYGAIYSRQKLDLFGKERDTDALLADAKRGKVDIALVNLLYDYGKYLTAAGSRESQPLNLQGQWNDSMRPPWSSNLTTNINFEMNYWASAACALDECLTPFRTALSEIAESGKKTAKINFGADGFACNHNVDIWRMTTPVKGNPAYMYAPLCGMWLVNELFTQDITRLGEAEANTVSLCEEAAKFALGYLVERDGRLVTCPSASPEAEFYKDGKRCALDYASSFETAILRECFDNCLAASGDDVLKDKIRTASAKLSDYLETATGINEWHEQKEIVEKGHRHFSPLYGLYPGHTIKYYGTPKARALAEKLFKYRRANAHGAIGWSAAWAVCLSARLHDGEGAMRVIEGMLGASLFPNLFGYHPPIYFQIDGNLGFVAGINAMMFYEEDGIIDLLPACPKAWNKGKVSGYKIGGARVSMEWRENRVIKVVSDRPIKVRSGNVAKDAILQNVTLAGEEHKA